MRQSTVSQCRFEREMCQRMTAMGMRRADVSHRPVWKHPARGIVCKRILKSPWRASPASPFENRHDIGGSAFQHLCEADLIEGHRARHMRFLVAQSRRRKNSQLACFGASPQATLPANSRPRRRPMAASSDTFVGRLRELATLRDCIRPGGCRTWPPGHACRRAWHRQDPHGEGTGAACRSAWCDCVVGPLP